MRKHSEETKEKIRLVRLGKHHSEETKTKISIALTGRRLSPKHKANLSKRMRVALVGHPVYEETRRKISATVSTTLMGHHIPKDVRQKISKSVSKAIKLLWQDTEYIRKTLKGWRRRPTKPEYFITGILIQYFPDDKWLYTGDGQFINQNQLPDFGGKIPDWYSSVRGCILEFFGEFYHKPEDAKNRINHFKKFGYNCIVIWEEELEDKVALIRHIKDGKIYIPKKHQGRTIYDYAKSGLG